MKGTSQNGEPLECQAITNASEGKEPTLEVLRRRAIYAIYVLGGLARRFRRAIQAQDAPRAIQAQDAAPKIPAWSNNARAVRAGDLVQVRSLDEIRETLDERGCIGGCKFIAQMEAYCGQEHRVARRIEKFCDEARSRIVKGKNLVLLDKVHCDGSAVGGCDRMCLLFWRTEWLKKLD